jgi:Polyketide cyclase / dehydrase and lipid transport
MASIRKEISLNAAAANAWSALRDFGAVHIRVAPGFLIATSLEDDARVVTFGNGATARERLIDIEDAQMRLVYGVVGGRFVHDNTSVQIFDEGGARCRLVWIRDMLPNDFASEIAMMMEHAVRVMKPALERASA